MQVLVVMWRNVAQWSNEWNTVSTPLVCSRHVSCALIHVFFEWIKLLRCRRLFLSTGSRLTFTWDWSGGLVGYHFWRTRWIAVWRGCSVLCRSTSQAPRQCVPTVMLRTQFFIKFYCINAVVTCEIKKILQSYCSLRRRPSEIIIFRRAETCLELIHNYFTGSRIFCNTFTVAEIILK